MAPRKQSSQVIKSRLNKEEEKLRSKDDTSEDDVERTSLQTRSVLDIFIVHVRAGHFRYF